MKLVLAAVFCLASSVTVRAADKAKPVKVFILAGQSNMEGKAKISLLDYQAEQPSTRDLYQPFRKDGKWVERPDVWVKFLDRKGKLTVGFGSPKCVGPELGFGQVVGDHYDEPVLLIKTAWGGRSLYRDFRPPGAGLPPMKVLEAMQEDLKKRKKDVSLDEIKATFGSSYRAMIQEVRDTLADLKEHFPNYAGQGYEIAGFVWFQGWNDMINKDFTAEYARNLEHLIRDLLKDLKQPNLPVVVAQMGVGGAKPSANVVTFRKAQEAGVASPEFKGNVTLVDTAPCWDEKAQALLDEGYKGNKWLNQDLQDRFSKMGSQPPYHYLGSAKVHCLMGQALGEAMKKLCEAGKRSSPN